MSDGGGECIFSFAFAELALHPQSSGCTRMRELIGRSGVLQFVADPQ